MGLSSKIKFTDQIRNSIMNSEYKAVVFPKIHLGVKTNVYFKV